VRSDLEIFVFDPAWERNGVCRDWSGYFAVEHKLVLW